MIPYHVIDYFFLTLTYLYMFLILDIFVLSLNMNNFIKNKNTITSYNQVGSLVKLAPPTSLAAALNGPDKRD